MKLQRRQVILINPKPKIFYSQRLKHFPFHIQECINAAGIMIEDEGNVLTGFSTFTNSWKQLSRTNRQRLVNELE